MPANSVAPNKSSTLNDKHLQQRLSALPEPVAARVRKAWSWLQAASEHGKNDDNESTQGSHSHQDDLTLLNILLDLKVDADTLCAALLLRLESPALTQPGARPDSANNTEADSTDRPSDRQTERKRDIARSFGAGVARLVGEVRKLADFRSQQSSHASKHSSQSGAETEAQTEALRRMLLAMVEDSRVVVIQLAERLLLMQKLRSLPEPQQMALARETRDIYAPLANRLGIGHIKWQLEDLAFRTLQPRRYKQIAQQLDERRTEREQFIEQVIDKLRHALQQARIDAQVDGRVKHIVSIWKKMQRKHVPLSELYDVRAVRIQVESVSECYTALGLVHDLWHPIPAEFDDYIANPKANNYRSLHTAVMTDAGKTLEVQIRTYEMHRHAELGVAAHWRYKEGADVDPGLDNKISWLRRLLEPAQHDESVDSEASNADPVGQDDEDNLLEQLRAETLEQHVYVFTPAGQVIELPHGATPLDFAYAVHTGVGHRCRGAKVDNRIVPLTYTLKTGEQVEILKARDPRPSRDWLNPNNGYLASASARTKVRHWFNRQDRDQNIATGRSVLDKDLKRLGVSDVDLGKLASDSGYAQLDDFLIALGRGDIGTGTIAEQLKDRLLPADKTTARQTDSQQSLTRPSATPSSSAKGERSDISSGLSIQGVGNLLTTLAQCCHPLPPDPIIGFITLGRGVSVHRCDCSNILNMDETRRARLIEVSWGEEQGNAHSYPVDIELTAVDRQGLLRDITATLSNERLNVTAINTRSDPAQHTAHMSLSLELNDVTQLSRLLDRLQQLPNVYEVRRR